MKGFLFKTGFRAEFPRDFLIDRGGDHRICKFGSKSIGFDRVFIKVLARAPNLEIWAQDSNLRAPSPGTQAQESKPRTPNPGNQTQKWTLWHRVGLRCLWSKPKTPISGFQTQESKPRDPSPGLQTQEIKPRNELYGIELDWCAWNSSPRTQTH